MILQEANNEIRENIKRIKEQKQSMSTINEEKEQQHESKVMSTWDQMKSFKVKPFKQYLGPTGIWMLCYYFIMIFIMIAMNIARVGWSGEAIFAAPAHFAQLFLNYGLNAGKVAADPLDTVNDFYLEKIEFNRPLMSASWLFAPMIVYVIGIILAIVGGSGYPQPTGEYGYLENFFYFNERTVGLTGDPLSENPGKGGSFYFLLVWLPIILSAILGAMISKRLFKDPKQHKSFNVIKMMLYNLFAGFIVGLQMGYMTGKVTISLWGTIVTIFTSSYDNTGYMFSGQYNPNVMMFTSWFINFIPIIIIATAYVLYGPLEDKIVNLLKGNPQNQTKKVE